MSDTYYGLSKMEYNLMKYFWNTNAPVSFSEVEKYCNTELTLWLGSTNFTHLFNSSCEKRDSSFGRKGL